MSKARLVITAVIVEGRSQADVARAYGVSKGWVSKLVARYRAEGDTAFEPRSRRPKTTPTAIAPAVIERIIEVRRQLVAEGLDGGPDTIAWHLEHHHRVAVSVSTIARILTRNQLVTPHRTSDLARHTSVSKPSNPTRPGKPTSPTTALPPASMSRSSPGSTITPATHCRSPHTCASPDQRCCPVSAQRSNTTAYQHQH